MAGRRAALPGQGYSPPARLLLDGGRCLAVFASEDGRVRKEFDFARLPVARPLQVAFAEAFTRRTGPAGTCKSLSSARGCHQLLQSFATYLADLDAPPRAPAELAPAHLDGYAHRYRLHRVLAQRLGGLKLTLRSVGGWDEAFVGALRGGGPARDRAPRVHSYSQAELRRIMDAARRDARQAAQRIRAGRQLLERWRAGELGDADPDTVQVCRILDHVETTGDVPRREYDNGRRVFPLSLQRYGTVGELVGRIHLGWHEAAPFVVLLVGLTGQNGGTIAEAPAAHHRPDGYAGGTPAAVVELVKPRRGRRSHMPVALADLPDWLTAAEEPAQEVSARDELHTPLGVYLLLRELTEPARRILGSDRLLVGWYRHGYHVGAGNGPHTLGSAVAGWGRRAGLVADAAPGAEPGPLEVSLPRLRLTAVEHRQQAVAHTDRVLANEYLGRNRGNLTAYQQLVARVLGEQVARAQASALMPTLTQADLDEARRDPDATAARFGIEPATLARLLAGELDTVLGACTDHHGGPYAPTGQACRASFMRCLDCPCARATPAHLPVQVLVLDVLDARRGELAPHEWARRFALPHAQLSDLLARHPPAALADARASATDADRRLVDRFLARELDHA